eukprot:2774253-Lingulodinium_polyedra.AAC.1
MSADGTSKHRRLSGCVSPHSETVPSIVHPGAQGARVHGRPPAHARPPPKTTVSEDHGEG